jgi:Spy/CpxP family protein refolding chaperone
MDGPGRPPHGPGMGIGRWWEHPEVQKKLELTPEQVEKLGTQRLETETKMIEVGSKKRIAQLRLRDLVSKKDASEEEINKKIDEIGDLQKEQMKAVIAQSRSVRSILNEDQQKKVEEFLKVRRERAHRGPAFRGGGPDGWGDRPWGKDGKEGKGDKGPGKAGKRGKDRGEGDGPRPPRRAFGMAPDEPNDMPGLMSPPDGPPAPPPPRPEFGGPAGPPEGPGAPGEELGEEKEGAPFPPEGGPEVGWAEGGLESDLLLDDFATFDEPIENILADFE